MTKMTRINIGMTQVMKDYIQAEAEKQGLTMSSMAIVYINQAIDHKKALDNMGNIYKVLDRLEEIVDKGKQE